MRLLLIRHGETALNAARVLQPPDTPLSLRGLSQARALAARLADEQFAAIWSSDLPRAWQTATTLAGDRPVHSEPLLRERDFGEWRGRPYDSLGFDPMGAQEAPPGGESIAGFDTRLARAWASAVATASAGEGTLVLVTHGLVIRRLLQRHIDRSFDAALPERIGNTSLTVVEGNPLRATLIDCTAHLDAERADDPHALSGG